MNKQSFGRKGEREVLAYLRENGYSPVCSNYRAGRLEIDLIAVRDAVLCFVEVKTRHTGGNGMFGSPAEAVGTVKRRNIIRASAAFLREYRGRIDFDEIRYDVAEVYDTGKAVRIHYIENAFYRTGRKNTWL